MVYEFVGVNTVKLWWYKMNCSDSIEISYTTITTTNFKILFSTRNMIFSYGVALWIATFDYSLDAQNKCVGMHSCDSSNSLSSRRFDYTLERTSLHTWWGGDMSVICFTLKLHIRNRKVRIINSEFPIICQLMMTYCVKSRQIPKVFEL